MLRWISALCVSTGLVLGVTGSARAQALPECSFGFEIDTQSSAFHSMVVDGEQKKGFWLSINRAPKDVREVARFIGRMQICLMTPDGEGRTITRNGNSRTYPAVLMTSCTATLLSGNRLLTNAHCFFDKDFVNAGYTVVREARVDFNYTSKDDTGGVLTYLVSPRELAVDKDLDALLLQILGGDPNAKLGGHFPMKMMTAFEPNQELRMVHHPGGDPQQYSTGTCQVHRRQSEIPDERSPFRHSCESTGGSSGSLVLDSRTLAVVALHNQGGLRPTSDSYNSGHKIALINRALKLGFEEVTPAEGGATAGSAANRALTAALLIFDPKDQAVALRDVVTRFPGTEAASNAKRALDRISGRDASLRENAAASALSDALLTANLNARVVALRDIVARFGDTDSADKAQAAIARLEADLAQKTRNSEATARLDSAKAAGDVDALRALLTEFEGKPFAFQVQLALLEVESAQSAAEAEANAALTSALLLSDASQKKSALQKITRDYANQPAATKAALALDRLATTPAPAPAPKPVTPVTPVTTPVVKEQPLTTAKSTSLATAPSKETFLARITRQQFAQMARRGGTQSGVIERGYLSCGVSTGIPGFSYPDDTGDWQGLDVDFCRAVAAAVLDDPNAVQFVPLDFEQSFAALASGEVDLLGGNISREDVRQSGYRFFFPGVSFFDGVAVMLPAEFGINSVRNIDGAIACVGNYETDQQALTDYMARHNGRVDFSIREDFDAIFRQYLNGACDVVVATRAELAQERGFFDRPDDHVILPETLTEVPVGPVVRDDDANWFDTIRLVLDTQKTAAQLGLFQSDLQLSARPLTLPVVQRLSPMEISATIVPNLNLPGDVMLRIVRGVGNFDEMFLRSFNEDPAIFTNPG